MEKNLEETAELSLHERIKILENGGKVLCKRCRKGLMEAMGDYRTTNTFICRVCNGQIIIN